MPNKKSLANRPAWDDSTDLEPPKVDPPTNDWEEKKNESRHEQEEEDKEQSAWLTAKKQEQPSKIAWVSQETSKDVNESKIDWFSGKNQNKETDQSKIPWLATTQSPLGGLE